MKCIKIDPSLIRFKVAYFFVYATASVVNPFFPVYFQHLGIPPELIGLISSFRPFLLFVGASVMGAVADKFQIHKEIVVFSVASHVLVQFSVIFFDANHALIAFMIILGSFLSSPIGPTFDATVLKALGDNKGKYGRQRLWGAVSWGVMATAVGGLATYTDNFLWHFYMHFFFGVIQFVIMSTFRIEKSERNNQFWKSCGIMLSNINFAVFFLVVFMMGCAYGVISTFLFIYLKQIGGSEVILGSSLLVTVSTEIVFFYFSENIIAKLGEKNLLLIALIAYIIRFVYYSYLTNPLAVYPAELLHGLTYAAMWSSSVSYAHSIAPKGLGTTVQGLLGGTWNGLGGGVGAIAGGLLFRYYGPVTMFRIMAGWCACAFVMFFSATRYLAWREQKKVTEENVFHIPVEKGDDDEAEQEEEQELTVDLSDNEDEE